jgi:hypothetical protein
VEWHSRGIGTFATDVRPAAETSKRHNRRDRDLLTRGLETLCRWLDRQPELDFRESALYGADTAGAAALVATDEGLAVDAVAVRNGQFDLIEEELSSPEQPLCFVRSEGYDCHHQPSDIVAESSDRVSTWRVDEASGGRKIADWFERELLARRPTRHI